MTSIALGEASGVPRSFLDPQLTRWTDVDLPTLVSGAPTWPDVTVVMPVHNGGGVVRNCIDALLAHTPASVRIVAIDDGSTAATTVSMLDELARSTRLELVRHETNQGYTATANHAARIAGKDDLVLLNSDAEVGPQWLRGLRLVAQSRPDVATVSAVSNDAGGVSVPKIGRSNSWFPGRPWAEVSRIVRRCATSFALEAPAGHGFCFLVRRSALETAGGFDEEAFPIGYGEEVDFSQRVQNAGFVNLIAPHVLVKHYRSQSFGSEKRHQLVRASRAVLSARYPDLTRSVQDYETSASNLTMRLELDRIRRSPLRAGHAGGPRTYSADDRRAEVREFDPFRGPISIWAGQLPASSLAQVTQALVQGCERMVGTDAAVRELATAVGFEMVPDDDASAR